MTREDPKQEVSTPDEDAILDAVARFIAMRDAGQAPRVADYVQQQPEALRAQIAEQCRLVFHVEDVVGVERADPSVEDTRRRIGEYAIVRELGRGGWGVVYLAEHIRLRRKVALKVLSSGLTLSKGHLERFRREAEVTSGLDDPGIVTVYEAGSDEHVTYIAMRYIEGSTLSDSIASTRSTIGNARDPSTVSGVQFGDFRSKREGAHRAETRTRPSTSKASIDRILEVFEKLAWSLHTAHQAQLIHRDIKPGNLIVDVTGQPVILDFGLARHEDGTQGAHELTLSGDLLGTPAYMSPEQLVGQRISLDRRTDIYSLAVTLFECLTLRLPFEAPTRDALYQKILVSPPPDPRRFNASIPRDVCTMLEVALEKDRERRYSTAADFAEDLRRVRAREPILARPAGAFVKAMRWVQRRPAVAASMFALTVVMTVATLVSYKLMRAAADSEGRAVEVLAEYDRLADLEKLRDAIDEAERLRPPSPALAERTGAWLREKGEPLAARLPQHREALRAWLKKASRVKERADRDEIDLRIAKLTSQLESLRANFDAPIRGDPLRVDRIKETRVEFQERLERELEEQRALLRNNPIRFDTAEESFRAEAMLELVSLLEDFVAPAGTLARIRARDAWCRRIAQECFSNHEDAWARAKREIRESPHYGGLRIDVQDGLVPLGTDPHSGLFEFGHPRSGLLPVRNPKNGEFLLPRGLQDEERREDFGLVFVLIPGGKFSMGAQSSDPDGVNYDEHARENEGPVHTVELEPFFLAKWEMSQAQWMRLGDGSNPSEYLERNAEQMRGYYPIEGVSYDEGRALLHWHGFVYPTEAQWEYAARAHGKTAWSYGDDLRSIRGAANLLDRAGLGAGFPSHEEPLPWNDGAAHMYPVHVLEPNRFGLHHIHGNVFEICREWLTPYEYAAIASGDGERATEKKTLGRVMRGGCFMVGWQVARVAARSKLPLRGVAYAGIRPVRVLAVR